MTDQSSNPPGWYPDPEQPGNQREWDGQAWTGPSVPSGAGAGVAGAGVAGAPPAARKGVPTWVVPVVACLALAVGLVIGGAIGGGSDDEGDEVVAQESTTTAAPADEEEPSSTTTDGEEEEEPTTTTTSTTTTTEAPTTTAAAAEPIVVSGPGVQLTPPFEVPAGDYAVHYNFSADCYYSTNLVPVGGETYDGFDLGSGTGPVEGDTYAYGVESGEYYIDLNTGPAPNCPWEITLTKQ